ncbi:MAG: flagellar protein FlaG [Methylotenera sp.]
MLNIRLDVYDTVRTSAISQKPANSPVAFFNQKTLKPLVNVDENTRPTALIDALSLSKAVEVLNEHVAPALQSIEFSLDQETDRMIVKVVDTATQKVLRQIPNEEVIAISKTLGKLQGLMIKQTA